MAKNRRQVGMVLFSYQELEELLGLSDGHIVTDVIATDNERKRDSLLIKISGPKIPYNVNGYELMVIPLSDIKD